MGKEFIEYKSETGRIPGCSAVTLCRCLTQYVKKYISANREVIAKIDDNVRDAILVDAINYLGVVGGCDYALYTTDLYNEVFEVEQVDAQCLLTVLLNHYAMYIFKYGIAESVLRNNHMNKCTEKFDENDGIKVLVDFINFIAEVNEYDRKFTIQDLYEKFTIQKHNSEMKRLREFLETASMYNDLLRDGKRIDNIFAEMLGDYNLYDISEDGTYYYAYIDEENLKAKLCETNLWTEVDNEMYAMLYAYGKMFTDVLEQSQFEIINKKLLEMKTR